MSTSSIPLFGRAWQLQVSTDDGQGNQNLLTVSASAWTPEALAIRFEVSQQYKDVWRAVIEIYNLNLTTQQSLITQGSTVELYAGYQAGQNYGLIFQGKVFQVTWERENVTDYKITLHCYAGLDYFYNGFVSMSTSAFSSQQEYISKMAAAAQTPFSTAGVDTSALTQEKDLRGSVTFGTVQKYFAQLGEENGLDYFCGPQAPSMGPIATASTDTPDVIYAPKLPDNSTFQQAGNVTYSLLGTPQQTYEGVTFRVLLDARMLLRRNPPVIVQLNMTQITQLTLQLGQQRPAPFEQTGNYLVGGVTHAGDSRSDVWYTEVAGFTRNALALYYAQ